MSGVTMIVVGLVLGLAGGWSIRTVLTLLGFGAGWLLANVFDASLLVTLVVAIVGAAFAWLVVRLAASIVFFVVGALVGLLVGARVFRLLEGGDGNLLLALVFIPAMGIVGGWVAEKTKDRFVAWGTSIAGAALVLGGIGTLVSGLAWLRHPVETWQAALGTAAWVVLSIVFRLSQKAVGSNDTT
ncbi:MAG: hypothetical protein ACJ714_08620 [Ornithinibacter sp.]